MLFRLAGGGVASSAAGIVGRMEGGKQYIYNCYNIGNMKGESNKGGIVGSVITYGQAKIYIYNVYNLGQIMGNPKNGNGGIIASIKDNGEVNIQNAYNLAKIQGDVKYYNDGVRRYYRIHI